MQVKKGRNRIVILLPFFGIVAKFPIIYFRSIRYIVSNVRHGKWKSLKQEWHFPVDESGGFKALLFKGIVSNWREWRFYSKTHNPFLQPTYMSIFGLLNFQKFGQPYLLENVDVWFQIVQLTKEEAWADSHHFANRDNYCICDGKLRMVDYGSIDAQCVIEKYGDKIVDGFDLTATWES